MFCELHDSARDHPKVLKLARDLGIPEAHAFGLVCGLWTWTLRMAPDGDLSSFDSEDIEIGCKWTGEPGALYAALIKRRLLDKTDAGDAIHDWMDFAGSLKAAKRKQQQRERKRDGQSRDVTGQSRKVTEGRPERTNDRNERPERDDPSPSRSGKSKSGPDRFGNLAAKAIASQAGNGKIEIRDYPDIREWCEKDPIGTAAAVTGENDDRSRGGWGKLLGFGSQELGGGVARERFRDCLERLFGEMKQGEIQKPGAQLNRYLKEAYGYGG